MSKAIDITTMEVNRGDFSNTRIVNETFDGKLADNEVLLEVDRFALTANNITYCVTGDMLGYWQFFPAEEGWGRVPVMAYADVVASAHPAVMEGERVWGFFPMSTHLKILAGKVNEAQFVDVSPHRVELPPTYSQFQRTTGNPFYQCEREDQDCLLRGLFSTAWLCEDFMQENNTFGASAYVITSASSKTSIALAHCVRQRAEQQVIGITSKGNLAFCESLGCYDHVLCYDDIGTLDAGQAVVLVDMAGNAELIGNLHRHFGDQMRYSCMIGITHYNDMGSTEGLPGASPEFFFARSQAQKRAGEWGAQEMQKRAGTAFVAFREFCDSWLEIERSTGPQSVIECFEQTRVGNVRPNAGCILSMSRADS